MKAGGFEVQAMTFHTDIDNADVMLARRFHVLIRYLGHKGGRPSL